ncbi:MAG: parallel beta-helix domain-containing protein [Pirellulales bacterium]
MRRLVALLVIVSAFVSLASAEESAPAPQIPGWVARGSAWHPAEPYAEGQPRATSLQLPFPKMRSLESNSMSPEKVALGKLLFFDPLLSGQNTISCAHCHHPDHGMADGRKLSMGFGGTGVGPERTGGDVLGRSAPSLWNAAYYKWQFWDGRADDLEAQAAGPITNEHEMGEKPETLVKELRDNPEYVALFQKVYGGSTDEAVTFENTCRAIAAFERTLLSFNSKFDRYTAGDTTALNEQERSGMRLFRSLKTRCFECHNFPTFADDSFRVIGVPDNGPHDPGRAGVPNEGPDGAFKTTSLRNIELTAPYMHNGAFNRLEEVIKFYAKGGGRGEPNPVDGIDDKIGKFDITDAEVADLVAFLKALTDTSLQPVPPEQVPSGLPIVAVKTRPMPATPASTPAAVAVAGAPASRPATSSPPAAAARPAQPLTGFSDGNLNRTAERAVLSIASARSASAAAGPWVGAASVAATFTVRPGQSIQAAVDRCRAGDRVLLEPGVYQQTVVIDTDGITLSGVNRQGERPVLDGGGTLADAVQGSGGNLLIAGLTIRNYVGNGIMVSKAKNVAFRNLVIENSGLYGVYPVECTGVLVEGCTVSGIRDAGIYVGSSRDVVVRNNEVYNNVAGIEIENSVGSLVENNSAHHNTTGILVFALPNNPVKECRDTRVINNRVWANNHENFAKPGTTVANLAPGVGIVVMAADRTEVTQNRISENDSYGIVVVSLAAARLPARRTVDVEPNSDQTLIVANQYENNGRHAHQLFAQVLKAPGGDLFWDGSGAGNDWRESRNLATFPQDLLGPAGPSSAQTTPVQTNSSAGGSK